MAKVQNYSETTKSRAAKILQSRQSAPYFIICAEKLHCYRRMGKEPVSCHLPSGGYTIPAVPVLPIRQIISPWG